MPFAAEKRRDIQNQFHRRIYDLAPGGASAKLSNKLIDWHEFESFQAFQAEIKKQFKQTIPLEDRDAWQRLFETKQNEVAQLTHAITQHERDIDAAVYELFNLTPEEIALIDPLNTERL